MGMATRKAVPLGTALPDDFTTSTTNWRRLRVPAHRIFVSLNECLDWCLKTGCSGKTESAFRPKPTLGLWPESDGNAPVTCP